MNNMTTTATSDRYLSERLVSLLWEKGHADAHYEVFYFGDPDKRDPLNKLAKISAETTSGLKRGWKVELSTVNRRMVCDQIQEELLAKLAEKKSLPIPKAI